MAGDVATGGSDPSATLPPPPITMGEGEANWGREMGEFVYGDRGELLPNEGEGGMGEREEEAGPKTEGEEVEARREGGSRGPMGTDESNAAIDAGTGPPAPLMSNLEAGVEGSSLAPSQFTLPVVMAPHH